MPQTLARPPDLDASGAPIVDAPDYRVLAQEEATLQGVDPDLVHRLITQESGYNPMALSPKGALGLMQLMPGTAAELGVDPTDPAQNVRGGVSYLKSLLLRYKGDRRKAAAAYNAGPEAVDRYGDVPPFPETQAYVQQVAGSAPHPPDLDASGQPVAAPKPPDLDATRQPIAAATPLPRPAPIQVDRQFTSDVAVTPAPPRAPERLGSAKTGGGASAIPGTFPVLDTATAGVAQMARGVTAGSHYYSQPTEDTLNAASDLMEGAGKAATPLVVAGALVNLPGTVATLGASWLAATAAQRAAQYAEATPAQQRFFSALAGTVVAAGGAAKLIDGLNTAAKATAEGAKAAARPLVIAAKLAQPGYGPGDVPGARGTGFGELAGIENPETITQMLRDRPVAGEDVEAAFQSPRGTVRSDVPAVQPPDLTPEGVPEPAAAPEGPAVATEAPAAKLNTLAPGSKPTRRAVPFPVADDATALQLLKASDPTQAHLVDVPLDHVVATQKEIDLGRVLALPPAARVDAMPAAEQVHKGVLPRAIEHDGQFYLGDGTHRAVQAWANGESTVQAIVSPVRPEWLAHPPSDQTFLEKVSPRLSPQPPDIETAQPPDLDAAGQPLPAAGERGNVEDASHVDATGLSDQGGSLAGPIRGRDRQERGPADAGGASAGGSEADRAQRGGLPSAINARYDGLTFVRQPTDANAARLTPAVTRELTRMADELDSFPFVSRTFNERPEDAGYDIVAGAGGAPVYHDILGEAPLAAPKQGKTVARAVTASRTAVAAAIQRVLAGRDIASHIQEGTVRVAEKRAANDWKGISRPWLPHRDEPAPAEPIPADLDQLIDAYAAEEEDRARYARLADIPTHAIDWGTSRGQGKRSGGTIRGGMSDAPKGIKHYPDYEHAAGVTPEAWQEIRLLEDEDKRVAIGALQQGRTLDEAMRLAYAPPQPASDTLDTGEVQPRLPEAGAVREHEVATPQFEAPFALSSETARTRPAPQPALFTGEREMRVPEAVSVPLATAAANLKAVHTEIVTTLTAPTVSHPARLSSRYLRLRLAQMMHTLAYANHALKPYRDAVEKLTVDHAEILDLADALEDPEGTGKRLPAWLQPWLPIRTEIFGYLKKQIAQLGIEKEWKAYYLGHVWETEFKEGEASPPLLARLIGRRPLQGPKSFLKQRTIPTMRQGVERFKKEPKTWNLVEIDLYKMQEMAKFILGRQALEDNKALGTWVFQTALKKPPEGMLPIPDPIGQVWAPPEITVHEAYDKLLMEGLESFIRGLGVQYTRTIRGGAQWGTSNAATGAIWARPGGPEGILMHEIGHTLDLQYGLWDRIVRPAPLETRTITRGTRAGQTVTRAQRQDPATMRERAAVQKELRALADLRFEGLAQVPQHFKDYTREREEKVANLVHAYLYAPDRARAVAPRAYAALDALIRETPALEALADLQQMRSLVIGTREATQKLAGPILLGRYYASPDVVRIFTNYLTPGLSANRLWALVRIPANALVQAKLSFSAFHAFTITQESAAMEAARGVTDVLRGRPAGLARLGKALVEPVAVLARGAAIKKEYLTTLDPLSLAVDSATNLLLAGGGRMEQSREYTNRALQKFTDNLRRANGAFVRQQYGRAGSETLGAALRLLPALVEAASYPIMQWLVPVAKVGATTTQIQAELARLPGRPTEATLLAIAGKAVNLADATLGEVIWDNYFLPRALMSAVHMVIMAPGWRGGSAVILARGLTDPVRRLFTSQRETYQVHVPTGAGGGAGRPPTPDVSQAQPTETLLDVKERYWSPYTSLAIATVLVQILVSEIYQRAHGAGHVQNIRDVAYPRDGGTQPDGKPSRVRLPGYAGIFYDILRHVPSSVLEYALGGTAPMPTLLGQLYHNETLFGDEIVDHNDPWRAQLMEYAQFLKEQFQPISVSSYGRRTGTPAEKAESVMGISPAPARVTRTPLDEYLRELAPPMHRTIDETKKAQARRDLQAAVRAHDPRAQQTAIQQGGLSPRSVLATERVMRRPSVVTAFEHTTLPQAITAYEIASPEERQQIRPYLLRKRASQMGSVPPRDRATTFARLTAALKLPVAPPTASGVPAR